MTARVLIAVLLVGLIAVAGAGCGGGGEGGAAAVTGRVVDDGTQASLAGATVRVGSTASAQTGSDGRFTISNAPTGTQTLVVTAGGHDTLRGSVALTSGTNSLGLLYLAPTLGAGRGAITGTLALSSGAAVGGGQVQSGSASAVSRSDGTGRFTLYNLTAGSAQVGFYDPNTGASASRSVTVPSGSVKDIGSVLLSSGPPGPPWP
jgi:hypothetical protein